MNAPANELHPGPSAGAVFPHVGAPLRAAARAVLAAIRGAAAEEPPPGRHAIQRRIRLHLRNAVSAHGHLALAHPVARVGVLP